MTDEAAEKVPDSYPFVLVWIHPETMVRGDAQPGEVLMKHWEQILVHARETEADREPLTYAAVLMAVPVPVAGRVVEEIATMMRGLDGGTNAN